MNLEELAVQSGIPARTIRFYIARGLVSGPAGAGRGAAYDAGHVARLAEIRGLQKRGLTLDEVARELDGAPARLPEPTAWWQYPVAEDVVVAVRAGSSPWRLKQIRGALEQMAARLGGEHKDE